jgi:flagellar assembly protein FliH
MSSSKTPLSNVFSVPISEFQYRQLLPSGNLPPTPIQSEEGPSVRGQWLSEEDLSGRLAAERAAAIAETEVRLRREYEERAGREAARIYQALEQFKSTQKDYFARVEAEVVQLALAIAGKILHREVKLDPLLMSALVRLALGQLKEGSTACIRVASGEAKRWNDVFAAQPMKLEVSIVEDAQLEPRDCILETELGTVNFNVEVQLKEVEKGFFDVLAQRPQR